MKQIGLLTLLLGTIFTLYGQDTLKVEPSFIYSSKTAPRGKCSHQYAREDIVFNENHKRIEYCYYQNNERICFGKTYKILNDSVVYEGDKKWIYKKVANNKYFISSQDSSQTIEFGYAKSIIPLKKINSFYTVSSITRDTL